VNQDKTEGPAQSLSFLGVQLDSVQQTLSCTPERVSELRALLAPLLPHTVIRRKHIESVLGKLSFAAQVLPGARPFMRRMLDAVHSCKKRSTPVRISSGFRADVRFWLDHLQSWNGRQRWRSSSRAPIVLATDASLNGFGFYLESVPVHVDSTSWPSTHRRGVGYCGTYSTCHAHLHREHTHIAWCELLAVYAAAAVFAPQLQDQSLLLYVDNSTDVAIINRQATRSSTLAGLLRQLYALSLRYNFSIRAVHRPGVDNILADFLSRSTLHRHDPVRQWHLTHPSLASRLLSVCFVSSHQFFNSSSSNDSSASLPVSHFELTLAPPMGHITAPSSTSAPGSVSTRNGPSQKDNSARSSSFTRRDTRSPHSPVLFQRYRTGRQTTAFQTSRATPYSTRSKLVSTITTATTPQSTVKQHSLSATSALSVPRFSLPNSKMPETGVLVSSPSSDCSASKNTPTVDSPAPTSVQKCGA
jgi:hypothetical protein